MSHQAPRSVYRKSSPILEKYGEITVRVVEQTDPSSITERAEPCRKLCFYKHASGDISARAEHPNFNFEFDYPTVKAGSK